jgi:hypothetical protein
LPSLSCWLADKGARDWIQLDAFLLYHDMASVGALPFIAAAPTKVDYTFVSNAVRNQASLPVEPRGAHLESASIMLASRSRSADDVCERESNVWLSKPSRSSQRLLPKIALVRCRSGSIGCVARSRQVCIYVVEALLVDIYLPEGKDVYIHIRPTLLPEAASISCLCIAEPATSRRVATETRPTRNRSN